MKRPVVLLTQRESSNRHGDSVDVLETAYVRYFEGAGFGVVAVSNAVKDPASFFKFCGATHLVLTGGGDIATAKQSGSGPPLDLMPSRDRVEALLLKYAERTSIPVLGICRGMQQLAVRYGRAQLFPLANLDLGQQCLPPRRYRMIWRDADTDGVFFKPGGQTQVRSYHQWAVRMKADHRSAVRVLAECAEVGFVTALRVRKHPFVGIQWHPERSFSSHAWDRVLIDAFRRREWYWKR